jgi:RNA polymerase sigma-70 factor (ECF subfamily)
MKSGIVLSEKKPFDELVEKAQNGDRRAFTQLYDDYLPRVYARVAAVIPREDIEDVTQEVFISIARSIQSYHGRSSFFTWVNSIIRRRVADYYRKRNRRLTEIPYDEENPIHTSGKMDSLADEIMLKQVLLALPDTKREVILLRLVEGLSFKEIAERTGVQEGAAKVRFYRAIASCREHIVKITRKDVTNLSENTTK